MTDIDPDCFPALDPLPDDEETAEDRGWATGVLAPPKPSPVEIRLQCLAAAAAVAPLGEASETTIARARAFVAFVTGDESDLAGRLDADGRLLCDCAPGYAVGSTEPVIRHCGGALRSGAGACRLREASGEGRR